MPKRMQAPETRGAITARDFSFRLLQWLRETNKPQKYALTILWFLRGLALIYFIFPARHRVLCARVYTSIALRKSTRAANGGRIQSAVCTGGRCPPTARRVRQCSKSFGFPVFVSGQQTVIL